MVNTHVISKTTAVVVAKIFSVITLSFFLLRYMPGGPETYLRAQLLQEGSGTSNQERVNRLIEAYLSFRPDEPLHIQYISYIGNILQGDFGQSIAYNKPVSTILVDALPWTVFFMTISLVLIFTIAIFLGAALAYVQGSQVDTTVTTVAIVLGSVPNYIAGILLIMIFTYELGWFPSGGRVSVYADPGTVNWFISALHHAGLIIASFVLTAFTMQTLLMRGNSISVLGSDYVYVAKLRGLPSHRITSHYVARNAVLPLYTNFMILLGVMFGGSVVLETIFSYAGLGWYLYQGVITRDYSLAMGAFILIAVAVILGIFLADLTYSKIDPRIGSKGAE